MGRRNVVVQWEVEGKCIKCERRRTNWTYILSASLSLFTPSFMPIPLSTTARLHSVIPTLISYYYTRHDFHATPSSPTRRGLMSLEALESLSQESRQTVGHLSESLSDAQSDALTDLMRSVRKHFPTLDNTVVEGFCSASKPLSRFQAVISLSIVY